MTKDENPTPNPARKKGGPRTPEGKRRSSLNALKHGLTAASPQALQMLAQEFDIDFDKILESVRWDYQPRGPVEEMLVNRIARCAFRLAIAEAMERRLLDRRAALPSYGTSYERVMKYERQVDVHLHRAINALTRKRESDKKIKSQNEPGPRFR